MKHPARLASLLVAWLILAGAAPLPVSAAPLAPTPNDQTITGQPGPSRVRLELGELAPRIVTARTRAILVRGSITNLGDRPIADIALRLQLGEKLRSPEALQTALISPPETEAGKSPFRAVPGRLLPGQRREIALRVPVGDPGLPIAAPGVYPLLVNVNGTPSFGGPARVGSLDLLLPVRSVAGMRPPRPGPAPPALTMLWPIADQPRRVGTEDDEQVLSDDELARSLAPGGRLSGLVTAAAEATSADPELADTICYAVDPDLVETVRRMTEGYRVRVRPGETTKGTGMRAARDWLNQLGALLSGRCVLSMPYADADLVSLARGGVVDLEKLAVTSSSVLTEAFGEVAPLRDVVWPASGSLDARSLSDLAGTGTSNVIMDPGALGRSGADGPLPISGPPGDAQPRAIRLDRTVSTALGGSSVERAIQTGTGPSTQTPADTPSMAVQNGLAAMLYRTVLGGPGAQRASSSMLIAPPRRWQAPARELRTLLDTAATMLDGGLLRGGGLDKLVETEPALSSVPLQYPPSIAAAEVPQQVIRRLAAINTRTRDLLGALVRDSSTRREPVKVVLPVQRAMLRAASAAWRGTERRAAFEAAQNAANQMQGLSSQISVLTPNLPISLASNESRLPVTVHNGLPVAVRVRIVLRNSPGLRTDMVVLRNVPPGGNRNAEITAQVLRPGRFTVDVALTTPGGTELGRPARIQLSSTAYGTVTLGIAGGAFVLLLLLSARRIYRRVAGKRQSGGGPPAPPAAATGMAER